ncbi:hypothetical protein ACKI16_29450 [Streptomyces scabiei]|uniref:hypothetical protein n=1 Tax=Streptomyces scabiei TaxID=1930 RepID=UPI0038F64020
MGCACNKKKEQFVVMVGAGNGRQVYASADKSLAVKVSGKYPGSVVKDAKGDVVHRNTPPAATQQQTPGAPDKGPE